MSMVDLLATLPTAGVLAERLGVSRDKIQYVTRKLRLRPQRAGNGPFVFAADEVSQIVEAICGGDLANGELAPRDTQ